MGHIDKSDKLFPALALVKPQPVTLSLLELHSGPTMNVVRLTSIPPLRGFIGTSLAMIQDKSVTWL